MLLFSPGSHVEGGTEAQARANALRWFANMRENGITDPQIVLDEQPRALHDGRWTFVFRHCGTGVQCELQVHGLTLDECDALLFWPRTYWRGCSSAEPSPLDWMAPGYVLAIIAAPAVPE